MIGQRVGMNGIGTLSEKTVHSVLKSYFSPDSLNQEIKVGGFVADICNGHDIIEIQTRSFDRLRRKLTVFLSYYPVTIVYPIPYMKWIRWVNPQTGEISAPRKSPRLGTPCSIFPELYKIKNFLTVPNLRLRIILLNIEEYRFLDGWSPDKKKGASPCDRIPTELVNEIRIEDIADYHQLIPDSLEDNFSSRDFKKASGLSLSASQTALNILHYLGCVERTGKKGNAYLYTRQPF